MSSQETNTTGQGQANKNGQQTFFGAVPAMSSALGGSGYAAAAATPAHDVEMVEPVPATPAAPPSVDDLTKGISGLNKEAPAEVDALGNLVNEDAMAAVDDSEESAREDQDPEKKAEDAADEATGHKVPLKKVKKLREGQSIVKLPPDELLRPISDNWLYPSHAEGVYGTYRRSAVPNKSETTLARKQGVKKLANNTSSSATKKVRACITFRHEGPNSKVHGSIGSFGTPKSGEVDERCLRMLFSSHSQIPSLRLFVERYGDIVEVVIFANSLVRRENGTAGRFGAIFMDLSIGDNKKFVLDPRIDTAQGHNGCMWITALEFAKSADECEFGAKWCAPQFHGMDLNELSGLVDLGDQAKAFGDDTLCPGDWVLYGLQKYRKLDLYRPWQRTDDGPEVFNKYSAYFCNAMSDVAVTGDWPHYVRQAQKVGKSINDDDFDLSKTVPPRDIVTKFRVTVENGEAVQCTPEHWESFIKLQYWPNAAAKAFSVRLSIERGREYLNAALQEQFDKQAGAIDATFQQFPNYPRTFWVNLKADRSEGGLFGANIDARPAVHSRVKLSVVGGEFDGVANFTGMIMEDAFAMGSELALVATLKGASKFKGGNHKINLEMISDGTSVNRQLAAISELGVPLERKDGVDLPHVILGAPPTIENTGSLADEVSNNAEAHTAFLDALKEFHLNEEQQQAAEASFESFSGLLTIWGPPGTGKTYTLLAMAFAHVVASRVANVPRRRILCTAPSNSAVDTMARTLVKAINVKGQRLNICRFRGGQVGQGPSKPGSLAKHALRERDNAEEIEPGLLETEAIWELIDQQKGQRSGDQDLQPYFFNNGRYRMIKDLASLRGAGGKPTQEALWYLEMRASLHKATGPEKAEERKAIRRQIAEVEGLWDQRYLESCDIVFVTNSSAAHITLLSHYKPDVILSDENALASLADGATPPAAFKESVKLLVVAGDHKQQGPPALSKGVSETYKDATSSLFELLIQPGAPGHQIMLRMQHRIRIAFSDMVNDIWYEGRLLNHPSLQVKTPIEVTLERALSALGSLWNNRLRLAVNVGRGDGACHEREPNSRSYINKMEAEAVVAHIKWLLSLTPNPKRKAGELAGARIRPEDILVVTPYKGQQAYIKKLLLQSNINYRDVDGAVKERVTVEVATSQTVQGKEREIVLFSWVRNNPENPTDLGFTMDSRQLCVNFSRVKVYQATFANWAAWMTEDLDQQAMFKDKLAKATEPGRKGTGKGRSKGKDFGKIVKHHVDAGDLVSTGALDAIYQGREPAAIDNIKATVTMRPEPLKPDYQPPAAGSFIQKVEANKKQKQVNAARYRQKQKGDLEEGEVMDET